jgi:hypothetical protein
MNQVDSTRDIKSLNEHELPMNGRSSDAAAPQSRQRSECETWMSPIGTKKTALAEAEAVG